MESECIDFLHQASGIVAPSGYEKDVMTLWDKHISQYVDHVSITPFGNVIAVKRGTSGKKIMLAAHADEIGLIITYIDDSGFLYFDEIGGVDTNLLSGRRVSIQGINDVIEGVIGVKPIHLQDRNANKVDISPSELWIDINVTGKLEAQEKVQIGCVATLHSIPLVNGTRISGKAMDNRCSLTALLSVAKCLYGKSLEHDIYYVATTQEELRGRGAQTAAYAIAPDICIVLDVTHATDYPSMSPIKNGDVKLGKGVVIALGPNMNNSISQRLISVAIDKEINYQLEALAKPTGTDANPIQITRKGVLTGLLSIPCRYMHSPVETIDTQDLDMASKLLTEFILNINNENMI